MSEIKNFYVIKPESHNDASNITKKLRLDQTGVQDQFYITDQLMNFLESEGIVKNVNYTVLNTVPATNEMIADYFMSYSLNCGFTPKKIQK